MKWTNKTVEINLNKEITIKLTGDYDKGNPQTRDYPGDDPEFEIDNVELIRGNVLDFLDWNDDYLSEAVMNTRRRIENGMTPGNYSLFEYFSGLAIQEILNTEND